MKILAIESTGTVASVAYTEEGLLRGEFTVNNGLTHSQTLLPLIDLLKEKAAVDLEALDAVAVAAGPGSFTGLRIGASTAKGIALALEKPIVPVSTLEALAWNAYGAAGLICPMMDARRDQVYTAVYRFTRREDADPAGVIRDAENAECLAPALRAEAVIAPAALAVEEIAAKLNEMKEPVLLLGDGAAAYKDILARLLQLPVDFAPAQMNRQRASSVAALAAVLFAEGKAISGADFSPEYLRLSQAERELAQKQAEESAS